MATSQAAYGLEKAVGHGDNSILQQDVASTTGPGQGHSTETMKALTWQGKNKVEVGMCTVIFSVASVSPAT
jgi:hypothetical protein